MIFKFMIEPKWIYNLLRTMNLVVIRNAIFLIGSKHVCKDFTVGKV